MTGAEFRDRVMRPDDEIDMEVCLQYLCPCRPYVQGHFLRQRRGPPRGSALRRRVLRTGVRQDLDGPAGPCALLAARQAHAGDGDPTEQAVDAADRSSDGRRDQRRASAQARRRRLRYGVLRHAGGQKRGGHHRPRRQLRVHRAGAAPRFTKCCARAACCRTPIGFVQGPGFGVVLNACSLATSRGHSE